MGAWAVSKQTNKPSEMKTRTYHITTLGSFAPRGCAGSDGYVICHDSPRYAKANESQLDQWRNCSNKAVRNAALTEIAYRNLQVWRNK